MSRGTSGLAGVARARVLRPCVDVTRLQSENAGQGGLPAGFTIRRFAFGDALRLVALQRACLARFLASEFWAAGTMMTAFHAGTIIGGALVWYAPNLMRNKALLGCIDHVFVKPGWRGHGLVPRLLHAGAAYLRHRGMSAVTLTVKNLLNPLNLLTNSAPYRVG